MIASYALSRVETETLMHSCLFSSFPLSFLRLLPRLALLSLARLVISYLKNKGNDIHRNH